MERVVLELGGFDFALEQVNETLIPKIADLNALNALMQKIKYGFYSNEKEENVTSSIDSRMDKEYHLQAPETTIQKGVGLCWDTVLVSKYYLNKLGFQTKMFYTEDAQDPAHHSTHTFIFYKELLGNNKHVKWHWYEWSWDSFIGKDYSTDTWEELLKNFVAFELSKSAGRPIKVYGISSYPKVGSGPDAFMDQMQKKGKLLGIMDAAAGVFNPVPVQDKSNEKPVQPVMSHSPAPQPKQIAQALWSGDEKAIEDLLEQDVNGNTVIVVETMDSVFSKLDTKKIYAMFRSYVDTTLDEATCEHILKHYIGNCLQHQWWVRYFTARLAELHYYGANFNKPRFLQAKHLRILGAMYHHDDDKLHRDETVAAYAIRVYNQHAVEGMDEVHELPINEEGKKAINDAWKYHVVTQKHHPEHWDRHYVPSDKDLPDDQLPPCNGSGMPEECIVEMIGDWMSASLLRNKTANGWYDHTVGKRFIFTEKQCELMKELLSHEEELVAEVMGKNPFATESIAIERMTGTEHAAESIHDNLFYHGSPHKFQNLVPQLGNRACPKQKSISFTPFIGIEAIFAHDGEQLGRLESCDDLHVAAFSNTDIAFESIEGTTSERDITDIETLNKFFDLVKYRVLNTSSNRPYFNTKRETFDNWRLLTVEQILKHKVGICYDTAMFADHFLRKWNVKHLNIFACSKRSHKTSDYDDPTHTFTIYEEDGMWHWLEGAWGPYKGNKFKANTSKEAIEHVLDKLAKDTGLKFVGGEFSHFPSAGVTMSEFYHGCNIGSFKYESESGSVSLEAFGEGSNTVPADIHTVNVIGQGTGVVTKVTHINPATGEKEEDEVEIFTINPATGEKVKVKYPEKMKRSGKDMPGGFAGYESYDPPYNEQQMRDHGYSEAVITMLKNDPVHSWRMQTGIELIHREPSKTELMRIWSNWKQMTEEQKKQSDKKCQELFGCTNEVLYNFLLPQYKVDKPAKGIIKYPSKEDLATEALQGFKTKKQRIIDYVVGCMDLIDPTHDNSRRFSDMASAMDEKQFSQYMKNLKDHKCQIDIVAPNMIKNLQNNDIFAAAHKIGCKLFDRVWFYDMTTGKEFLSTEELPIFRVSVRRQEQMLDEKLSVPNAASKIDSMTGQVSGDDQKGGFSQPEIQIMYSKGFKNVLKEFVKIRGGDVHAFSEFERQLEETGTGSMDQIKVNSRARSGAVLATWLEAIHLANNV